MTAGEPVVVDEAGLARWGEAIGRDVALPVVLGLDGPLGAGKSVLARAIGRGAGVEAPMPSPSYNLLLRYEGRSGRTLVHLDLYRLEDPSELDELGWADLGASGELVVVEWPERAGTRMPRDHWLVRLTPVPGHPRRRAVRVDPVGTPPPLPESVPGSGL